MNLPDYPFRFKIIQQRKYIFDSFRKKYIVLTPEENVRQLFAHYLVNEKKIPAALMAIEYFLRAGDLKRRCDIVVFSRDSKPLLIVECKAPQVSITPDVFDQITRYNRILGCPWLVVTNGIKHFCCSIDLESGNRTFLPSIPVYQDLAGEAPGMS